MDDWFYSCLCSHAGLWRSATEKSGCAAEALPCHRVVNKEGRTAPGWSRQRPLLEEEGVTFKSNGHVDMQRHLWEPEVEET